MTSRTLPLEDLLSGPLHCLSDHCIPPSTTAAAPSCLAVTGLPRHNLCLCPKTRREGAPVRPPLPPPHLLLPLLPHPLDGHLPQNQPSGKRRKGSCQKGRFPANRVPTRIRRGIAMRICPNLSESIRRALRRTAPHTRCRQVTSAQMSLFIQETQGLARLFPKIPEDKGMSLHPCGTPTGSGKDWSHLIAGRKSDGERSPGIAILGLDPREESSGHRHLRGGRVEKSEQKDKDHRCHLIPKERGFRPPGPRHLQPSDRRGPCHPSQQTRCLTAFQKKERLLALHLSLSGSSMALGHTLGRKSLRRHLLGIRTLRYRREIPCPLHPCQMTCHHPHLLRKTRTPLPLGRIVCRLCRCCLRDSQLPVDIHYPLCRHCQLCRVVGTCCPCPGSPCLLFRWT